MGRLHVEGETKIYARSVEMNVMHLGLYGGGARCASLLVALQVRCSPACQPDRAIATASRCQSHSKIRTYPLLCRRADVADRKRTIEVE